MTESKESPRPGGGRDSSPDELPLAAKLAAPRPRKSTPPPRLLTDKLAETQLAPLPRQFGEIQLALREAGLIGWLLYDHRGQSPLVARVLGLEGATADGAPIRPRLPEGRYFYWVPASDMPALLVHEADAEGLPELPGDLLTYTTYAELRRRLVETLPNRGRIAMEHSPVAACPDLSRVDAGTLELVRGLGVEIDTSAELVNRFFGPLSESEVRLQQRAQELLSEVGKLAICALAEKSARESDGVEAARAGLLRAGLEGPMPRVTAGPHTRRRVHVPSGGDDRTILPGELVLVELYACLPGGPYAHQTLTLVRGAPQRRTEALFERVAAAKNRAIELLGERFGKGTLTLGYEVDRAMRDAMGDGRQGRILGRGGHHLGFVPWSAQACTFDDTEIHDTREALSGIAWSIHPTLEVGDESMRVQASVRREGSTLSILDFGPTELVVL